MIKKTHGVYIICMLLLPFVQINGQSQEDQPVESSLATDTIPLLEVNETDLESIMDLRSILEKENNTYSKPTRLSNRLQRQLRKDKLDMSDEALYWARRRLDPSEQFNSYVTFRDTIIVSPIYMPLILKRDSSFKEYTFYKEEEIIKPKHRHRYDEVIEPDTSFIQKRKIRKQLNESAYRHIRRNRPDLFRYTYDDLPKDVIRTTVIEKEVREDLPLIIEVEPSLTEIAPPTKFIPDLLYWTSLFQSEIRFSQNYISPNWHKGGNSNINLYTRNHLQYNYKREKVNWTNELESKASLYNSQKDTVHRYQIGEDVFRIHSNLGYEAFSKWYYTFDAEFKTQLFTTFQENSQEKLAAFLAPFTINLGLGMKYDLDKSFEKKGKHLKFSVNLAPASYTYMYSVKKHGEIDLGRHGFKKKDPDDENSEFRHVSSLFGSTIRADLAFSFNPQVTWTSRVYYFTSYDKVVGEFENSLDLAISRYFSTKIYLYVRFDDSVVKKEDFDSYLQFNQLLSFGFSYKW